MKFLGKFSRVVAALFFGAASLSVKAASLSVAESGDDLSLSWPRDAAGLRLESVNSLNGVPEWEAVEDLAVVTGDFYSLTLPLSGISRYFRLGPAPLTTVRDSSPANGEIGVGVLRETILRFTAPLAPATVISPDQFHADVGDRRLLTRVELATDRRTASLFYLEPMPGGAQVTASFDGSGMLDDSGRPLDPDGDGNPGGVLAVSFQTFNTTPLANTAVIGRVYASAPGNGGANHPLANVTITVDGQEQTLRARTDENGAFILKPCPVGRFFVKIDGRTASESQYPNGGYYPFVGKPWEAVAGKLDNLAGGTGEIFLPWVETGTLQPTAATADTTVTFPPSVLAADPALEGVFVTVPANSLYSNEGVRGGRVGIAPVPPDRLPAPLPPGVTPPLVITVQTDGANNLDRPAPVRFPNLPDRVTGQKLPPGAKTALWGFNHKSGRWEIQGPGTIAPDGLHIDTDPGYGVRQPGWFFFDPSNSGSGGGGGPSGPGPNPDPDSDPKPDPQDPDDPCKTERKALQSTSIQCVAGTAIGICATIAKATPGAGCVISAMQGVIGAYSDCKIDPNGCRVTIAQNVINTAIGCIPVLGAGLSTASAVSGAVKSCVIDEAVAYGNYQNCKKANGLGARGHGLHAAGAAEGIPDNIWLEQLALLRAAADMEAILLGGVAWTEVEPEGIPLLLEFYRALQSAMLPGSDGDTRITQAERAAILALPRPSNLGSAAAAKLILRMDQIAEGTLPESELDLAALSQAAQDLLDTMETLVARGWTTAYDAFFRGLPQPFKDENKVQSKKTQSAKPLAYRLVNLSGNGAVQYGRLNLIGQIDNVILAANDLYRLDYSDPDSFYVGHTVFRATGPGQSTTIPKALLGPANPLDSDGDGLPDEVELALGTNPNLADTDGDGVSDGAETAGGTNPLVAAPAPVGIVGSAPADSEMLKVAVSGSVALVAQRNGLGVYSIVGAQPSRVAGFPLAGDVASVAISGKLGLATMDGSGLAVLDLSNPLSPQLARFISFNASGGPFLKVVAAGNLAYALTGDTLYLLDIAQGVVLDQRAIDTGAEQAQPQDLALSGGWLYLLSGHVRSFPGDSPGLHHLRKIRVDRVIGADVAALDISGAAYPADVPLQIAATAGFAYITGLNGSAAAKSSGLTIIADGPDGLKIAAPPAPLGALCLAANGSGSVLVGSTNLFVLDVRNPAAGAPVVASFPLPSPAKSVAVSFGRACVADGLNGLKTANYFPPDTAGQPPSLSLAANFSLNPPLAPPSRSVVVSVAAMDDTQVRAVEFYYDGALVGLSGTAPFDFWFKTPSAPSQFTVRARAIDTGGNSAWSDTVTVLVRESAAPPAVVKTLPAPKTVNPLAGVAVAATFDKALDPASVTPASLRLQTAGPDGILNTADDLPVPGTAAYSGNPPTLAFTPASALAAGEYRATVGAEIADTNGNHLPAAYTWNFAVKKPVEWVLNAPGAWFTAKNWSTATLPKFGDFVLLDRPAPLNLVTFAGGTANLDSLLANQSLKITGGSLSLARLSSVANNLSLDNGSLLLATGLDIGGRFNWGSGTLDGGGALSAANIDIAGTSPHIGKITLVNRGHALWHQPADTGIFIDDPATVWENAPGSVFEIVGPANIYSGGFGANVPQFNNRGLLRIQNGAGFATALQGMAFNNTGSVEIETGSLELRGQGGKSSGPFRLAAGAELVFKADNQTAPGALIQGEGGLRASGGATVLNGPCDIGGPLTVGSGAVLTLNGEVRRVGPVFVDGANFTQPRLVFASAALQLKSPVAMNGGSLLFNSFDSKIELPSLAVTNFAYLSGASDVTVTGPFVAAVATFTGPGRLVAKGASTLGNIYLYQSGNRTQPRPLDNAGQLSMVGDINAGAAQIRNLPGATFECLGDYRIAGGSFTAAAALVNSGSVVKSAGNGSFTVEGPFNNSGLVVSRSGTINASRGYLQTGGETRLDGGRFAGYSVYEIRAGLVTGSGAIDIYQFNNTGAVVSPGLPGAPVGSLLLSYAYNQKAAATFAVDIAGTAPGAFDRILADGPATLDGLLKIAVDPAYQPALGDTFRILQCAERTGQFAQILGADLGGGLKLAPLYDNFGVTLKVVSNP